MRSHSQSHRIGETAKAINEWRSFPVKRLLVTALVLAGAAAFPTSVSAQFPSRPVHIVVPFPAGSATDAVARILGASVSSAIGQPVIIGNKPGADGAIAAVEVARASPDGYTLLLATNSPMSVVPAMKRTPPYDPVRDFTAIADIGRYTLFMVAHPSVPATTVGELVQFARVNPNKVNYATGNTAGIVSMALFASLAKIEMVHVPYRGEPPAITDLIAGHVQLMIATSSTVVPQVREGKLRPLAVTLAKRSRLLPDVQTVAEAGMPELLSVTGWAGLFGPAGIPKEVVQRLNLEFTAASGRPDVQAALGQQEFVVSPSTPERLSIFVKEQLESYRSILRVAGVQPE